MIDPELAAFLEQGGIHIGTRSDRLHPGGGEHRHPYHEGRN